jgi:hypothetical protein
MADNHPFLASDNRATLCGGHYLYRQKKQAARPHTPAAHAHPGGPAAIAAATAAA